MSTRGGVEGVEHRTEALRDRRRGVRVPNQTCGVVDELRSERGIVGHACAARGDRVGRVADEQVTAVLDLQPSCTGRCGNDGNAKGEGFEDLDA